MQRTEVHDRTFVVEETVEVWEMEDEVEDCAPEEFEEFVGMGAGAGASVVDGAGAEGPEELKAGVTEPEVLVEMLVDTTGGVAMATRAATRAAATVQLDGVPEQT